MNNMILYVVIAIIAVLVIYLIVQYNALVKEKKQFQQWMFI